MFADLSHLDANWSLLKGGKSVGSGVAKLKLPPESTGKVELALPTDAMSKSPDALRIAFDDPRGWNVVTCQFQLAEPPRIASVKGTPLPAGLVFPSLNLVTEVTGGHPLKWRVAYRSRVSLRNVKTVPASPKSMALGDVRAIEADMLLESDPPAFVGRVRAEFADGVFSYHIDWTGADAWAQELGWTFEMPACYDRFSWSRQAVWSYYPDTHIGRPTGTATPDTANVHLTRIDRPDAFDFNSTRYNCDWASLTNADGEGLVVQFAPDERYQVRGGFGTNGSHTLVVNRHVGPPHDFASPIVPDFYLKLSKGDSIDGSFIVGSAGVT